MSRADISAHMAAMLVYLRDIGPDGCDYARKNQTLVALEDRGLARFGGTRTKPRVEAWHIDRGGLDWLAARAAADAATVR